jgi:hypothetical protein
VSGGVTSSRAWSRDGWLRRGRVHYALILTVEGQRELFRVVGEPNSGDMYSRYVGLLLLCSLKVTPRVLFG